MNLRDIEYFAAIAEHRHLGRAAGALGLGQPALSLSLRRLEKSADAKLVKRTPKGVELTEVGKALLAHIGRLKLAREDLAREVSDLAHGQAGHLRVGTGAATVNGRLPDACNILLQGAPKVTVDISMISGVDTMLPVLRAGELDIVVTQISDVPREGLVREPLWEDEFVVYASIRHPLARRKSVLLADLVTERWVTTRASALLGYQSLLRTFEEHGLPAPQIALMSESTVMNCRIVAALDVLGISARQSVALEADTLGLKIIPVADVKWIRPVAVVYRKDGYLSPVARRLIEILKTMARESTTKKR